MCEDGDHIVFGCKEMWRPEARRGGRGRAWTTRGGLSWTLGREKGGEMEEWDLVEGFFHRIQGPHEEGEDEMEGED